VTPLGTPAPPQPPPQPPIPQELYILAPEPPLIPLIAPLSTIIVKLIREITRIYIEEQKWDSGNSSFDQKLTIFHDIRQYIDLPEEAIIKAFPTILKGLALDYFYNNEMSK
jgi:hypothetical protein